MRIPINILSKIKLVAYMDKEGRPQFTATDKAVFVEQHTIAGEEGTYIFFDNKLVASKVTHVCLL